LEALNHTESGSLVSAGSTTNPYYFFDSDLAFETAFSDKLPRDESKARAARKDFYREIFDPSGEGPGHVADLLALVFRNRLRTESVGGRSVSDESYL
jgi:hypothetical protein